MIPRDGHLNPQHGSTKSFDGEPKASVLPLALPPERSQIKAFNVNRNRRRDDSYQIYTLVNLSCPIESRINSAITFAFRDRRINLRDELSNGSFMRSKWRWTHRDGSPKPKLPIFFPLLVVIDGVVWLEFMNVCHTQLTLNFIAPGSSASSEIGPVIGKVGSR